MSRLATLEHFVGQYRTPLGVAVALLLIGAGVSLSSVSVAATGQSSIEQRVQRSIGQLGDERLTPARNRAQQDIEAAGDAGVRVLMASLHSPNPILRRNAVEMLGYMTATSSAGALVQLLETDSDALVRSEAATSLGELDRLDVVGTLERAAALDSDARVRQAAAEARIALRSNLADMAGQDERNARDFAVAPHDPTVVYLAEEDRVFTSHNAGTTWSAAGTTPSRVMSLAVDPTNPDIVYAGTESLGIAKSTDGGATWSVISSTLRDPSGAPVGVTAIAVDPNDPSRLFAAKGVWIGTSQARLFPAGVMTSSDAGVTWKQVSFPQTENPLSRLYLKGNTLYGVVNDQVLTTGL